jgi:uncharacterized RDD family membrane protein YckC
MQVLRGISLVFTLAFTNYLESNRTSRKATLIIAAATWFGSSLSHNSIWTAIAFGIPYSLFFSLYLLCIKRTLPLVDGDVHTLVAYQSFFSILLMIPLLVASREFYLFWTKEFSYKISMMWFTVLCVGMEGYVLTLLTHLQIKYSSPLTTNIWYIAKNQIQLLTLMIIWNNPITPKV